MCRYVCRVLKHMDLAGQAICLPDAHGVGATDESLMKLKSNYLARAQVYLPRQGDRLPWKALHNYAMDIGLLRYGRVDDGFLKFSALSNKGD